MQLRLEGSTFADPAIRAEELAAQIQQALWEAQQKGQDVPTGPVVVDVAGPVEPQEATCS